MTADGLLLSHDVIVPFQPPQAVVESAGAYNKVSIFEWIFLFEEGLGGAGYSWRSVVHRRS